MGTRKGKNQQLIEAELKLKAEQNADQAKMRDPQNSLKSAKASDQSSANAMNAAVNQDVKAQEKQAAEEAAASRQTGEAQDKVDELQADIKSEKNAKIEAKRFADEKEAEIERRSEERYQKKMATRQRQSVVTVPTANDADNFRDCCVKIYKAIEKINRLKNGLCGGTEKDVKIWLEMLKPVKDRAKSFSKKSPNITVPTGRRNWHSFNLICGDDDRENRIYRNEFIGACMQLVEASVYLPDDWLGSKWIDYTKAILKELQKH